MALSRLFKPVRFDDLPGWPEDDASGAFDAFRKSANHALHRPYRAGSLGVDPAAFADAYSAARAMERLGAEEARTFFERYFVPALVAAENTTGFVTGYYEPEVDASPVWSGRFSVPLYARPPDLVDIDNTNRPEGMDPYFAFGRSTPKGPVEYFDRKAISTGAIEGQGLEIAWLESKVDAFFIHVQGAARLRMTNGALKRVTYAAKTGHYFTGIGRELVNLGEIPLERVTMQSIRAWLAAHPDRVDEILWRNRSYIFFRETEVSDPGVGPIAAAKVPLTPGRSIAVDRFLHTFGTPFFIDAPTLAAFGSTPFRRLMIAQDTGSAITGATRGDLFAGSGDQAGEIAGVVKHAAEFYALLPRGLVEK